MSQDTRNKRGFTLVELLVVMAIIGILSSIVLVSLVKSRAKARDAARIATLGQLQTAFNQYYLANASFPNAGPCFSKWDVPDPPKKPWGCGAGGSAVFVPVLAGGFVQTFPQDPSPSEGGSPNYLFDGAAGGDRSYLYVSDGTNFIFGTNLETKPGTPSYCGDYLIRSRSTYQGANIFGANPC